MKDHEENRGKEAAFSESLEELKRRELESKLEIERAQKRKEEFILQARNEIIKNADEENEELDKEKKRLIALGLRGIEKDVSQVIEKADKEAERIRKGSNPKKLAEKLLPVIMEV